jgi:hypothetical protein
VFTPKLEIPERGLLLIGFNYRRFRSRLGQGGVWGKDERRLTSPSSTSLHPFSVSPTRNPNPSTPVRSRPTERIANRRHSFRPSRTIESFPAKNARSGLRRAGLFVGVRHCLSGTSRGGGGRMRRKGRMIAASLVPNGAMRVRNGRGVRFDPAS